MANLTTRKKVFICNMVICFLCLVSILGYFIMPFWKVEVSYTLTADTMKEMILDVTEDTDVDYGEGENEVDVETDDIINDIDFTDILGEDGLTLALSIRLETTDVLSSLTGNPEKVVGNIVSSNVENLVAQLNETIDKVAKAIVSVGTKTVLKEALKEQVKQNLGENATNEEVQAELNEMGLNDEYIDQQTDKLVEAVYAEGATTDSVAEETVKIVEEALVKMNAHDPENYVAELSPEDREDLKAEISDVLVEFTDENGVIDINGFASSLLTEALGESEDENLNNEFPIDGMRAIAPMSAEEDSEEVADDLKTALTDALMEALGEATEYIVIGLKALSGLILFSFFTWAYLIIKILAKLRMKNNAIKLKLPIWLGSIPFTFLYLLPTVAMMILKKNMVSIVGEESGAAASMMEGFNISFFSCAWLSFVIGAFLFFFAIFYYGKLRKLLRKIAIIERSNEHRRKFFQKMKKDLIPDDSVGGEAVVTQFESDEFAGSEFEEASHEVAGEAEFAEDETAFVTSDDDDDFELS